jgi:hypothetical protein
MDNNNSAYVIAYAFMIFWGLVIGLLVGWLIWG